MLPVYIVHWKAPDWCARSVTSICASDIPVALTVIDNGGAPLELPGARIIGQPENLGYAGGANVGIRDWMAGEAPWAVVCSHDLQVEPGTFARLLAAGESDPTIGIVGPEYPDRSGALGRSLGNVGAIERREWISGTCLLLRRECIEGVGMFDEQFRNYVEDVDLCYRARDSGWTVCTAPGANASGIGSISGRSQAKVWSRRNRIVLAAKRGGWRGAGRGAVIAAKYVGLALRERRWRDAAASARGLGHGVLAVVFGARGLRR